MLVIPVIDIRHGWAVRARGGDRAFYEPICSPGGRPLRPLELATRYVDCFGLREWYVADLDGIVDGRPNLADLVALARASRRLWLDVGWRHGDANEAGISAGFPANVTWIIATETVRSPKCLQELARRLDPEGVALGLDLRNGVPIVSSPEYQNESASAIIGAAVQSGFRQVVVLDLADVGSYSGCHGVDLVRALRQDYPEVEWTTGGGIRGPDDLATLRKAGCSRALVGSALWEGRLSRSDCHADGASPHE